jgi:DNA-binding CsgD family transcriptional regulator
METILFLYYLIAFSVGMYSIGCIHSITKSNKNEIIKLFLIYYSFFTAFLGVFMIWAYLSATVIYPQFISILLSSLQFLFLFLFLFILAVLVNTVFEVKRSKLNDKFLLIFTVIWWILCSMKEFISKNNFSVQIIEDEWYIIILYLYILIIYLRYNRKKKDKKWYTDIRIIFFIIILSTPGLIIDGFLTDQGKHLYFTPAFMVIMSFLSLLFLYKYNVKVQETQYTVGNDFRAHYAITERENDVIILLLKGYSYNKIADTLCISISTVRTHVMNIYKKTNVNSRYELYNKLT